MHRWHTHLFAAIVLTVASLAGPLEGLRSSLTDLRFAWQKRQPSGNVVVVAIDAKSMDRVGTWPWHRSIYADVLARLSQFGVTDVAFDIDLSARADPDSDRKFSVALADFGGSAILPVFKQVGRDSSGNPRLYASRPLPEFASESWLATANVVPEHNGLLRRYPHGDTISGERFPSIAAMLVGQYDAAKSPFIVDLSIDVRKIAIVSLVDILDGVVDATAMRGKKVIIGGTAVELGDRFAVPIFGVVSGVEFQALAAESLLQGRVMSQTAWPVTGTGLLLIALLCFLVERHGSPSAASLVLLSAIGAVELGALGLQSRWPLIVDSAPWLVAMGAYMAAQWLKALDLRSILAKVANEKFQSVARSLNDAIIVTNSDGRITFWNSAAESIFQVSEAEALDQRFCNFLADAQDCSNVFRSTGDDGLIERTGLRKDGSTFPLEIRQSSWDAGDGRHHSVIVRDITSRRQAEERVHRLAMQDELTGLANRTSLCDVVKSRIVHTPNQSSFGLFLIDLDNFKEVNDTLGHDGGDKLLREFSRCLTQTLQGTTFIARLGGDEFAVIADVAGDGRDLVGASILSILGDGERPITVDGRNFLVSASVGSAVYPQDGGTLDELLSHADLALYSAKKAGRALHVHYRSDFKEAIENRRTLEIGMRAAVANGELELFYQPQVMLGDGKLIGAEALMRWRHPERGLLLPGEFLPALHGSPLLSTIGDWTLRTACSQAAAWHEAGHSICVGVNLFPAQFAPGLTEQIARILGETALPPHLLEIEITENVLLCDDDKITQLLQDIHFLGVRVALDDFGTGFASLTHLKRFPLDRLKIDRSFVTGLRSNSSDTAIVRALVALSQELGLATIAEGIEDASCVAHLAQLGCEQGQGYHFGRPMTALQFDRLLVTGSSAILEAA